MRWTSFCGVLVLLLAGLVAAEPLWTGTPHLNAVLSCFTGVVVAEGYSLSSRLPGRSCPSTVRNKNFYPPHVLTFAGLVAAESLWAGTPHLNAILSCFTGVVVAEMMEFLWCACASPVALPVSSVDLGHFFDKAAPMSLRSPAGGCAKKSPKWFCVSYITLHREFCIRIGEPYMHF